MADPGQSNRFRVTIDSLPLGTFSKCEGLKATYDIKTYDEGGENGYTHNLPGRVKYENITLTRPIDEQSKEVAIWFASFRAVVRRANASITILDASGKGVMDWALSGVVPVSWSAGAADIGANNVVTETLVLSHEGFLAAGTAVGNL